MPGSSSKGSRSRKQSRKRRESSRSRKQTRKRRESTPRRELPSRSREETLLLISAIRRNPTLAKRILRKIMSEGR